MEEEQHAKDDLREQLVIHERRVNSVNAELDEMRTTLESAERARKAAENELYEASERVNELSVQLTAANGQKRKAEADIGAMQVNMRLLLLLPKYLFMKCTHEAHDMMWKQINQIRVAI